MSAIMLRCPYGLGDAIYVRPVIRDATERYDVVYAMTPWTDLYADLPLRYVRPPSGLRLQDLSIQRQDPAIWHRPPAGIETKTLYYNAAAFAQGNVYEAMASNWPAIANPVWDLPPLGQSPIDSGDAPLAIVRPALIRSEWPNPARNPRPEYISELAGLLKDEGWAVLVICKVDAGEYIEGGEMPPCNMALTRGELSCRQLLATVRDASLIVGGVGWAVPAAVATRTPTYLILGGCGGANGPEKVLDPRMDAGHIGFAWPREYCQCTDPAHDCPDKTIEDLAGQFRRWRTRLGGVLAPRPSPRSRAIS